MTFDGGECNTMLVGTWRKRVGEEEIGVRDGYTQGSWR